MDAFEKWVEDYALMYEREITKADCEAAYRAGHAAGKEDGIRAGMRRAAEISREQCAVVQATLMRELYSLAHFDGAEMLVDAILKALQDEAEEKRP